MGKLEKKQEALAEQSSDIHDLPSPKYTSTAPSHFPDDDDDDDDDDDNTPSAPPPGYIPGPSPYQKVPVGWNLYYKPWSMRTYHIGTHADQPVFSLELHSGLLSSRPFLILLDGGSSGGGSGSGGADTKTPPRRLATAHRDGLFKAHAAITLLLVDPPLTEKLTAHTRRLSFSFPVSGTGNNNNNNNSNKNNNSNNTPQQRRQDFEWRYSHGKEVRALDRWGQGWKLVHLDSDGDGGGGSDGKTTTTTTRRMERPHGETSDGRPVVAVLADNSKWSRTKLARFHFVGAGATDEFGEAWALYVTMTALRIWEMTMNAGTTAVSA